MASITQPVRQDDRGGDLRIERVGAEHRDEILGLLLSGKPGRCDAAEKFCAFAAQHKLVLSELWAVHRGDIALAATLIIATAGRTAMVFVSPLADWHQVPPCSELLKAACAAQDPQQATLLQALLDPGQALEAQAVADADFTRLAHLIYMQRQIDPSFRPVTLDKKLRAVQWSEQHHETFANAILASYQDTQDCPGLLGLRHIDDIIAGHKATGTFDSALWTAWYDGDTPVAVMLLNLLPPKQAVELVYLGVCPSWRGRGLARKLLLDGLHQAADRHVQHMLLAVDQDNEPALKLYKSLGFTATARKLAMIFTLYRPPQ